MTTIVDFIAARLDEVEAVARAAIADDGGQDGGFEDNEWLTDGTLGMRFADAAAELIRTFAVPRRILADIAAKRKILAEHEPIEVVSIDEATYRQVILACVRCRMGERQIVHPCPTLRLLALPFDQHSVYDETWRP